MLRSCIDWKDGRSSDTSESSYSSDDERPCRKNPQSDGRTDSIDDEHPCCNKRSRCNHRQCCFCKRTDKTRIEPRRYPYNIYSLQRMLQVKVVVPGLRSARKKELRGENFDEIMSKHSESIRHGPFGPQILDPKSGLWRHFNDRGRTGKKCAFSIEYTSKKGEKFRGRCPKSCKICHGCPPGCFLKKRLKNLN